MGRPKLDPAVTQRIVDLVRAGNHLEVAATAAGIHRSTLHRWLKAGKKQLRGRYRKLLESVEKAQAEAEARDVAIVAKAAPEDWKAAAWRLERRAPWRYGFRVQLEVQQQLDAMLDKLQKGLPAETYDQVLTLLTAEDEAITPSSPMVQRPSAGGE